MPRIIINDHSPQVRVASVSGPGPPAPARHAPARPCDAPACLPHAWPPVSSHVFSRMSLPVSATRSPPPPSLLASAMRCATPRPRDSSTLAATLCGTLCDSPPIGSVSCCCKLEKTLNSASSAPQRRGPHAWRAIPQPPTRGAPALSPLKDGIVSRRTERPTHMTGVNLVQHSPRPSPRPSRPARLTFPPQPHAAYRPTCSDSQRGNNPLC